VEILAQSSANFVLTLLSALQRKKVSKKGFKGFSGGKGFTTLQKTLACYHRGFLGKKFFKGFSVSYFNSNIISLMVHLYALQPTTWAQL